MSDTTFTAGTVVASTWLNDVNTMTYLRGPVNVMDSIDSSQWAAIEAGTVGSQTRATVQAGFEAAIAKAVAEHRTLRINGGIYALSGGILLPDGLVMEGEGAVTSSGYYSRLDFATNTGATASLYSNNASDITLSNFYLNGRTSGSGNEIENQGNSRRMTYEKLAVVSSTTGAGIAMATSGYNIQSECERVVVAGTGYGFVTSASSTSNSFRTCYANVCTDSGFLIRGTYHSLSGCASDGSSQYGYLIQDAVSISLVGCGAESNGRAALAFSNARHVVGDGFRSVANNTGASAAIPSFAMVNDASSNLTFTGCEDTVPNAATTSSIANASGAVGDNMEFSGIFTLPFASSILAKQTPRSGLHALCQFDGTAGSPTPIVSRRISSITKNGTGDYTLTVTTPMVGTTLMATGNAAAVAGVALVAEQVSSTADTIRVRFRNSNTFALTDSAIYCDRTQ